MHERAGPHGTETSRTGVIIRYKLAPLALMAVISLLADKEPKAMSVATSTDIGTARTSIQARFNATNSMMTAALSPFPASWSRNFMINWSMKINMRTTTENKNGAK